MRAVLLGAVLAGLLAGCGGDEPERGGTLVATLGDSITAGSPGYDPDPRRRAALGFGDDEKSQWQYWAAQRHPELRFRNCGVWGERTDEIARRFAPCAQDAEALVVQGGINDLVQGRSPESAAANLRALVRQGLAIGLRVSIANVLPWNNGWPDADPRIRRLNELLAEIGRSERVPVLPFYETLDDPARPGRMPEGLTPDGDHPSIEGYRLLGERAFGAALK